MAIAEIAPEQQMDICAAHVLFGGLSKNAPSGDNCSTPNQPYMIGTGVNCSENVPSDQKHNSAETTDNSSADSNCYSNRQVALVGKGYS